MDHRTRLYNFASTRCIAYLIQDPILAPYANRLSVVLVGSVATGLCDDRSDIDIALVCDDQTYGLVSAGTDWASGRPTEVILGGVQLHYYAISLNEIAHRIHDLDDLSIHIYLAGVPLIDPGEQYARLIAGIDKVALHERRLKHARGHLERRLRVLEDDLSAIDRLALAALLVELTRLVVKTIALIDGVAFDPRKRILATGLSGPLGQRMQPAIMELLADLGELGTDLDGRALSFPRHLRGIVEALPQPD